MKYIASDSAVLSDLNNVLDMMDLDKTTQISLDENAGIVQINHPDSSIEWSLVDVVKALRYGFSIHESAKLLTNQFYQFETVDIEANTRNKSECERQTGRVIGENGKAKRLISELSGASITVSNDYTVAIIGSHEDVLEARDAIYSIIEGTPHSQVYCHLERYQAQKHTQMM